MTDIKFPIGRLVATPGVINGVPNARLGRCLELHIDGDWGSVPDEDKRANDQALIDGTRLFSSYPIDPTKPCEGENRLWIITEADRSVTTFLLPEEY